MLPLVSRHLTIWIMDIIIILHSLSIIIWHCSVIIIIQSPCIIIWHSIFIYFSILTKILQHLFKMDSPPHQLPLHPHIHPLVPKLDFPG